MIHALAHVQDAEVGEGSHVWQFASVIRGAAVGRDCSVGSCAIVDAAIVGDGCLIGHGAQIHPGTLIGNRVFVGPGVIFCNDMWPSTRKEGWGIEAGRHTIIVEDGAVIGAGAVVLPGIRIGKGAMVSAGAVCDEDVPANCLLRRNGYVSMMPHDGGVKRRMRWAS